jgi:metal-responsive CopG/Arc/MetJ family transcriptional regulator
MARLSISLPDELLSELETKQSKYQSFSGFCCSLLEKGLKIHQAEQQLLEDLGSQTTK